MVTSVNSSSISHPVSSLKPEQSVSAETAPPAAEVFSHDTLRLILWRHAGALIKKVGVILESRSLPKPYLAIQVSHEAAALVALAGGHLPPKMVSLSITDDRGARILDIEETPVHRLEHLNEYLKDAKACKRLAAAILRHAPTQIRGWTKNHAAAFVAILSKLDRPRTIADTFSVDFTGAVDRWELGVFFGWAMDRRQPFRSLQIDVYRDGSHAGCIEAKDYRPDLRNEGAFSGRYGFKFESGLELNSGSTHIFEFRLAGTPIHLPGSPFRIVGGNMEQHESDSGREPSLAETEGNSAGEHDHTKGLAAGIDFVDGRRVTGWAFDRLDPARTLTLLFEIDGTYAGQATANENRDDLTFMVTNRGHGFQVELRTDALNNPWRRVFRLDIRDQDSGKLLITGYPIHFSLCDSERESSSFARRIARLGQTLEELREQLPQLRRRMAYALHDYDLWYEEVHREQDLEFKSNALRAIPSEPTSRISVLVPLSADCTLPEFERVLSSLTGQDQVHEYLIANRSHPDQAFEVLARSYAQKDTRFTWIDARFQSISTLLQNFLARTDGKYLLLLHSGESVSSDALDWMALTALRTNARVIYADSDRIDATGRHSAPELRPDFNPDLLLSTPYIGAHCVQRDLLQAIAPEVPDESEGVWQYDLLLRYTEQAEWDEWLHIARVLTHRKTSRPDVPADNEQIILRSLDALQSHLTRTGSPAQAEMANSLFEDNSEHSDIVGNFAARLRWPVPHPAPKVSIIIPTKNEQELVRNCIQSIHAITDYPNFEIVLVDHDTSDKAAQRYFSSLADTDGITVLRYTGAFNWSAINNLAATHCEGEILCFLNNDTEAFLPDWLTEMVGHACRAQVGAVGAKLLHADGTLQHGGVVLGVHGIAEHAFTGLGRKEPGYMMRAALTQNLSAVTGACLVCRRTVFESVGGFEMVHLGTLFSDIDLCLRLDEAGYRNVWTPHAQLYHLGSKSRGTDYTGAQRARFDREVSYMRTRWANLIDRDPHYHPAFERHNYPYSTLTATVYSPLEPIRA